MIVHICVCIHVFMYIWPNYIENDNRMEVATVSLYLVFVKFIFLLLPIRLGKVIKWPELIPSNYTKVLPQNPLCKLVIQLSIPCR